MGFRYSRKIIKIIRFSFTLLSARTHVSTSARRTRTGIYPQNTAQKYCFFLTYANIYIFLCIFFFFLLFEARGIGGLVLRCPLSTFGRWFAPRVRHIGVLCSPSIAYIYLACPPHHNAAKDAAPPAMAQCGCSPCGV